MQTKHTAENTDAGAVKVTRKIKPLSIEEAMGRIDEMIAQDKKTGEHPTATLSDYIGWATEEIKLNK